MPTAPGTLGILVHSGRHFDYVRALTDAAVRKGKQVRICLMGPGTAMIHSNLPSRLDTGVRLFVCGSGGDEFEWMPPTARPTRIEVVSAARLMKILKSCDRHVAF